MRVRHYLSIVLLAVPTLALAGRPGTPDNVTTWVDGSPSGPKHPQVCTRFRNTAKVNVGFFVEWSKNGQQYTGKDLLGGAIWCPDIGAFAYRNSCAARIIGKPEGGVRPSDEEKWFCLKEFEADTDYCFRFRTYDEDGLWSQYWSPTSCARTPPTPAVPTTPEAPQLTVLPAETGRGAVGLAKPVRALLEWPASSLGAAEYIVQRKKGVDGGWSDIDEIALKQRFLRNSMRDHQEFEVEIPFSTDPPSDRQRYGFRICGMNWGGRTCSAPKLTPLGLQHQAQIDLTLAESAGRTGNERLRAEVVRGATYQADAGAAANAAASLPDLGSLAERGAVMSAEDSLAALLRASLANDETRRGFDIAVGAVLDQKEWGPGKQKILDSLDASAQSGFKTAWSYLLDRNRYADRARLGAAIASADAKLTSEREAAEDARQRLGFDIATAIFGNPAQGAQGNTAAGPGAWGIRNSLSPPAQRGFDAAMKLHLARKY